MLFKLNNNVKFFTGSWKKKFIESNFVAMKNILFGINTIIAQSYSFMDVFFY